jgi:hypothetical protein
VTCDVSARPISSLILDISSRVVIHKMCSFECYKLTNKLTSPFIVINKLTKSFQCCKLTNKSRRARPDDGGSKDL